MRKFQAIIDQALSHNSTHTDHQWRSSCRKIHCFLQSCLLAFLGEVDYSMLLMAVWLLHRRGPPFRAHYSHHQAKKWDVQPPFGMNPKPMRHIIVHHWLHTLTESGIDYTRSHLSNRMRYWRTSVQWSWRQPLQTFPALGPWQIGNLFISFPPTFGQRSAAARSTLWSVHVWIRCTG